MNYIYPITQQNQFKKNSTGVDTLKVTRKFDLARLKWEIENLDISILQTTSIDLSKLIDVVKVKLLKRLNIMN